jgi:GNAT superfamily N-acetyltransferase
MPKISIIEAQAANDVAAVVRLLRDYLLWMHRRYRERLEIVDAYFEPREWESELADLPGHYGAPHGGIVLALVDGVPAGCVLLRGIGEDSSEMKRLFVRPAFRGLGLGRRLIEAVMTLSCQRGYAHMYFESGALQSEAEALYRSMGFKRTPPYYACPTLVRETGRFYEATPCAA